MTFNTLADVPAPIRDFYTDAGGTVDLIPFGDEITQAEFYEVMAEQAGQQGGTLTVKAACEMLEAGLARLFHDSYIEWLSSEPIKPEDDPAAPVDLTEYHEQLLSEWQSSEPQITPPCMMINEQPWATYNHAVQKSILLDNAQVEIDGLTFHANESSQGRLFRTIARMEAAAIPSLVWTLADGTAPTVTLAQLKAALQAAIYYQSSLE
jgi:hypothetical protein